MVKAPPKSDEFSLLFYAIGWIRPLLPYILFGAEMREPLFLLA